MFQLKRGEIWFINFPYTFDNRYPKGKKKFVLILQDGYYFKDYNTTTVLLITKDIEAKDYETNVTIELGTTKLKTESYIICAQPYTIIKELFEQDGVWCVGTLSPEKLNEVDEALFIGLCMGKQNEFELE